MTEFLGDDTFDAVRAGKKAACLHEMKRGGFTVPEGFVVRDDEDVSSIADEELASRIARIGGFPVAVRSSGALEDLAGASFAGQYETYLDVADVKALRARIDDCRASARSERVQAYLKKQGLSPEAARVSVLVQRMVRARIAGVAFSIHPVTGREEHALVELVTGLGEKLVSGHVAPSRYVLDMRTGGVVEQEIGPEGASLTREETRALTRALVHLQAHFHAPQDVEWAVDESGTLHLLQSRPITSIRWRTDVDEYTNADFKDGGISARVCTPLMYGLYRDALQTSMQRYFESLLLIRGPQTWIASYYGRGYWNASAVKRALAKVPGFREDKFDQDLGIQKDYGAKGPLVVPTTVRTVARAIPVGIALERAYVAQLGVARRFATSWAIERAKWLERIDAFARTDDARFFTDCARVIGDVHARVEQTYFTTIYNNSNAQSDFKGFLAKLDAAIGRPSNQGKLMSGLDDVRHMDVQRGFVRLYAVAKQDGFASEAWTRALDGFLHEHGFHADAELELTCPRWSEAPERVRVHVEHMIASGAPPADPDKTVASQRRQFEEERSAIEARIRTSLRWRARFSRGFRGHLTRVRAYLSAREQMREYSTQIYAIVRAYAVEAGRRLAARSELAHQDDVFFLDTTELVALANRARIDRSVLHERIDFRKAMYAGYRDLVPPNELGRGVTVRAEESFDGKNVLRGLGCSPGRVEGIARVVPTLDDVGTIRKGDILVTRFTDPGWTPVLGMVAGVVTEVGGLLSHAAVIGREYGIPAVLNLPGATKALKSGQRIRIDGESGVVELVDDAPAQDTARSPVGEARVS